MLLSCRIGIRRYANLERENSWILTHLFRRSHFVLYQGWRYWEWSWILLPHISFSIVVATLPPLILSNFLALHTFIWHVMCFPRVLQVKVDVLDWTGFLINFTPPVGLSIRVMKVEGGPRRQWRSHEVSTTFCVMFRLFLGGGDKTKPTSRRVRCVQITIL